jgi:hypothetical protein
MEGRREMIVTILTAMLIAGPIYYLLLGISALVFGHSHVPHEVPLLVRMKSLALFLLIYPGVTLVRMVRTTHIQITHIEDD